jgi:hypothetical protein
VERPEAVGGGRGGGAAVHGGVTVLLQPAQLATGFTICSLAAAKGRKDPGWRLQSYHSRGCRDITAGAKIPLLAASCADGPEKSSEIGQELLGNPK